MTRRDARPRLTVVGPIFFEVFLPGRDPWPPPGEERYVRAIPTGFGGAINAASVAAALGIRVTLVHPFGGGPSEEAARGLLKRLGVREVLWPSRPDPFVTLVIPGEDRSFLSAGDDECLGACPRIPPAPWVLVGGVKEALRNLDRVREVRARGARVCTTGCWSLPDLDRLGTLTDSPFDLLVLNRREAERATGRSGRDAVETLLERAAREVVVTDGSAGARGFLEGRWVEAGAVPVPVLDPTGAGDAFTAALLAGRLRGRGAEGAMGLAAQVAARVVGIRGGCVTDPSLLAGL
jgi:sugar/nucleoside kinase (ribokinase family)